MAAPSPARSENPIRQIAGWSAASGGVILLALAARALFAKQPPPPPLLAVLVVAAFAQVGLGVLLALRRNRLAWSFLLALYIVGSLVALFALPTMLRAGIHPIVATLAVVFPMAMIVLLSLTDTA